MIEEIQGLTLPAIGDKPGGLFPYQLSAVNKLFDQGKRFLFLSHGTGCGKSISACAIAQELINRDEIDLILFFTLKKMKTNIQRMIHQFTQISALSVEGTKAKRVRAYEAAPYQTALILNYERAHFDFDALSKLVKGRRVLFILDEVQRVLIHTKGKPNNAGAALKKLVKLASKESYLIPMSATTVGNNPERYFHLFDYVAEGNPLKNISTFRRDFSSGTKVNITPWGRTTEYIWDLQKLEGVRNLVEPYTHQVRKSDPGVRELFQETHFVPIYIELSDEDRELYDLILESAEEDGDEMWGQYYKVLRYICNTAESLQYSKSAVAQTIVDAIPGLSSKTSSKIETLIEMVTNLRDEGDKIVIFTEFTNLGLFLISDALTKAKIKHVVHYGVGQSDKESQAAQDAFKEDESVTVFLSSDAGAQGLSLQVARHVINFEPNYSFDLMLQRNDRIDRADSHLENLTSYVFICENTVEERIWSIVNQRREMSSAVQGTVESFERNSEPDMRELMFTRSG